MAEDAATRRLGRLEVAATLPSSTDESDELAYGQAIGRYLVLGVLGRGGMGIVYEAYDPVLDRRIAVKRLREITDDEVSAGRARMQREAQAIARLSHPNVITVHDVNEHGGAMYIAMELVQGSTLREWQLGRGWRELVGAYGAAGRGLAAAHAAGLIHRDFKPENVLVGRDGRVRVTDFGLARLARDAHTAPTMALVEHLPMPSTGTGTARGLSGNLTAAGAVIGTPSYMAPEQIDGEQVDERSDQYAWCIALWEAIYGEQPFIAGNLALRSAAMKTDTPKPPPSARAPRAIARILQRGLAADPAKRWPSMDALRGALERETSSRRLAIGGAGLTAIAVVAAVFAVGQRSGEARNSCARAGGPADALWTPAIERDLVASFAATGAPYAGDAAVSLGRSITAWRTRWQRLAVESCEATRVHASQTEATLDLRTACLMRTHDQLRTAIAGLTSSRADRKAVEAAAGFALPDLDACNDVAALAGETPPPRDPRARFALEVRLDALERILHGGLAIVAAERLVPEVEAQVGAAIALGWLPLVARARRDVAELQAQLGKGKAARNALIAAAANASAAGEPDELIEIYLALADVEARLTSEFALGEGWNQLAGGTLARLGPRPGKQLAIARSRGVLAQHAGHPGDARTAYTEALAIARTRSASDERRVLVDLGLSETELGELDAAKGHLDRALALARTELGEHHPKVAQVQHDLGVVVYRQGHYAEAEQLFRTALAVRAAAYGKDSTDYALTVEAIGNAEIMQDRVAEARADFEQAIRIFEARLGPEHPDVANAYNDVGSTYHRAGMYALALANQQHVLALREKALGPDHPDVAESLVNLAIEAKNLERWELIDPSYRRALALFTKAYGPASFEVGVTYINLGEAKRAQRQLDAAAAAYAHAQQILGAKLGENHPLLAHVWNGTGQLELARGHVERARPLLERAVAMREHDKTDATDLAESRFALATAIAATDRPRAITLATAAREAYRGAGPGYARRLGAVEAWLAHP
jgi:eukaryotic-like serine/threonine-protein kinase